MISEWGTKDMRGRTWETWVGETKVRMIIRGHDQGRASGKTGSQTGSQAVYSGLLVTLKSSYTGMK